MIRMSGAAIGGQMKANTIVVFTRGARPNTFAECKDSRRAQLPPSARGAVVMMDNTWATPIHFRPLEHGVDISIHAATKISGRPFGRASRHRIRQRGDLGTAPRDAPDDGLLCRPRRCLPGAARAAHHGRAGLERP